MTIKQRVLNTSAAVVMIAAIGSFTVATTKQQEKIEANQAKQEQIMKESTKTKDELDKQIEQLKKNLEKDKADLNAAKHISDKHAKDIEALKK